MISIAIRRFHQRIPCLNKWKTNAIESPARWIEKQRLLELPSWEGDKIFLRLIDEHRPFFSLKLTYENDTLKEAVLDGKAL